MTIRTRVSFANSELKKILNWLNILKHEGELAPKIFLCSLASYIIGFIIWNKYLNLFSFFEYNIFQIRYISAALLFFLFSIFIYWFVFFILSRRNNIISIIIFLFSFFLFNNIFPFIPQYFGGGRPILLSLIGSPEQISYLENFGVQSFPNAGKEGVQTLPICLIYQNNDNIVLGFGTYSENGKITSTRILTLTRNFAVGSQLPSRFFKKQDFDICKETERNIFPEFMIKIFY